MHPWVITILVALSIMLVPQAQDNADTDDITFTDFENETYDLQGQVPASWQNVGNGIYRQSVVDPTALFIQSAPVNRETLVASLLPNLQLDALPEISETITTEHFTWDIYRFDVQTLAVTLALTNTDTATHLVLLQAPAATAEALDTNVYRPVLQSVAPLATTTNDDNADLPYISEDVRFASGDIMLAGTFTRPTTDGQHPVVVLISGSGASDRNASLGQIAELEPFREIADHLTRAGIAVLRYDDRGVGASEGDFAQATFVDFVADASAAVDYLTTRDDVNAEQIGLLGHSEGGALAPEVAVSNADVSFVISMAGSTVDLRDVLLVQNQRILEAQGVDQARIDEQVALVDALLGAIEADDADATEAALRDLLTLQLGDIPDDNTVQQFLTQYQSPYFSTALTYDPVVYWSQVDVPVLAVFGGLDTQVDAQQNIPPLENALSDASDVTITVIDAANHLFQRAETGGIDEYGTLEQAMMPAFLNLITDWLLERVDPVS